MDYILANDRKSSKSLLILAGLSGGSNEGYCLDLGAQHPVHSSCHTESMRAAVRLPPWKQCTYIYIVI